MKTITLLLLFFSLQAFGQTKISGIITDEKDNPVAYANVYLDQIYDGSVSNESGKFSFTTEATGGVKLVVSYIGYKKYQKSLTLEGDNIELKIKLKSNSNELQTVEISAGSFEVSDKKQSVVLKPLDVVQTPGSQADIYAALQSLPGAQQVGNESGLFVRGGTASETKTIIDGMLVNKPFFSDVPDIPQRGRFSPFLFSGVAFSTGGYSAEYGQALSSVLILDSEKLPENPSTNIGIMPLLGASVTHNRKFGELAVSGGLRYNNLQPYFSVNKQRVNWDKAPESFGTSLVMQKEGDNGSMAKLFVNYDNSRIKLSYDGLNSEEQFYNKNQNLFASASMVFPMGKEWILYSGVSLNFNEDDMGTEKDIFPATERMFMAKLRAERELYNGMDIKFGGEVQHQNDDYQFNQYFSSVNGNYEAFFAESNIHLGNRLAFRAGVRLENNSIINKQNIAPRLSMAYKTGEKTQVSLAYGKFYQQPESDYLRRQTSLGFENATHYIANFQWIEENRYTFRTEVYYKDYDQLVLGDPYSEEFNTETMSFGYSNGGNGYAKGIDLFWRDEATIPNSDYWISYSYIDSERYFRDYPIKAAPDFIANHTLNLIYRYSISSIRSKISARYAFATGRPYNNPTTEIFMNAQTPNYHNFSADFSYLTNVWGHFAVCVFSVKNLFNTDNIFGYEYSPDGMDRTAKRSAGLRSIFFGIFISMEHKKSN
ncbi:TonB-dependent receptor [Chondrinema litorale]|uniref:TonB-dependent receptor n=1 Tax=Chondrinema litorale TaxID=2994555 RepID=UPI0025432FC8|nr:TonB-dependent receptor [Chondrinema litorale]UZR97228.1 TonB-dependent receptor [Chondrinema litorale]